MVPLMKEIYVPQSPAHLSLALTKQWNGTPAPFATHALVRLSCAETGLRIHVSAKHQKPAMIPPLPQGRLDGLWNYDVVEVFLVGEDGTYLEVELGAGGHWLVLSFSGVRERSDDHNGLALDVVHRVTPKHWESETVIPWSIVPPRVSRLNAFAIHGGTFLAYRSVPGHEPDFHQPASYPQSRLEYSA
jgi:hypothetical protein